jgi:hypothetical protein
VPGGAGIHSEPVHINFPSGLNIWSDIFTARGSTLRNERSETIKLKIVFLQFPDLDHNQTVYVLSLRN